FDKVQVSPGGGTKPSHISRIRRNFRLKEDDMHEFKLLRRFSVGHFPKNQALSWCRHSGNPPIFAGQHGFDFLWPKPAQSNLNQSSNNTATHLVQKAIAFDDESEQGSFPDEFTSGKRTNG